MPRIIDIVRARRNFIETNNAEADRTGALGIAAILSGFNSQEWRDYIAHLGDFTPAQLARLRAEDNTAGDLEMDKKRVYMVANGMCGMQSPNTQTMAFRVNSIDEELEGAVCDPEP
jgi:hypothetical protein